MSSWVASDVDRSIGWTEAIALFPPTEELSMMVKPCWDSRTVGGSSLSTLNFLLTERRCLQCCNESQYIEAQKTTTNGIQYGNKVGIAQKNGT